jgi:NAD(P)H-hydrate epimerase
MLTVLSRELARKIDADAMSQLQIPGLVLMENAARGVADHLVSRITTDARIVILCGPGNNGGDGLALARQLAARSVNSEVLLIAAGRQLSKDAAANLSFLQGSGIPVVNCDNDLQPAFNELQTLNGNDWIVDALLGSGLQGPPRQPFDEIITAANHSPAQVLAVDIPSGLDCDSGLPLGATIRATLTVTFVAQKSGFQNPSAAPFIGHCEVEHIGLPSRWVEDWYARETRT